MSNFPPQASKSSPQIYLGPGPAENDPAHWRSISVEQIPVGSPVYNGAGDVPHQQTKPAAPSIVCGKPKASGAQGQAQQQGVLESTGGDAPVRQASPAASLNDTAQSSTAPAPAPVFAGHHAHGSSQPTKKRKLSFDDQADTNESRANAQKSKKKILFEE